MDELAVRQDSALAISIETEKLIKAGVSGNTIRAYRRALRSLDEWLHEEDNAFRIDLNGSGGYGLNDTVLAEYITQLHRQELAPSTISQAVAAVKWRAKSLGRADVVGAVTERSLAGIRPRG